ncbi:secretagogin-like isoform X2 [Acanthaster planci]|uniref:Secretagogin-like isoform X2 n=1 Tax=Acanthaster planci TaxID=133434 RepID=A0A8B7YW86_ACAPL|nr:secretagogin-like isoform X2 [Acanthaster planci]
MSKQRRKSYVNFLQKYPDLKDNKRITADKFSEIFLHYDTNDSGYIDDEGLDKFFRDLLMTTTQASITPELVEDLKECFMESYDDAKDGRIAITELANILPTDENFILLFRLTENLTSSVELMTLWKKYDKNKSGYITKQELGAFIKDLLAHHDKRVSDTKIEEYVQGMLKIFDKNNDGHLSLTEMAKLLSIKPEENFLITSSKLAKFEDMSERERLQLMNEIFDHYDKGRTGYLEGVEIDLFVKDLHDFEGASGVDTFNQADSMRKVEIFKRDLMKHCDVNQDNKLSKAEVRLILGFH